MTPAAADRTLVHSEAVAIRSLAKPAAASAPGVMFEAVSGVLT